MCLKCVLSNRKDFLQQTTKKINSHWWGKLYFPLRLCNPILLLCHFNKAHVEWELSKLSSSWREKHEASGLLMVAGLGRRDLLLNNLYIPDHHSTATLFTALRNANFLETKGNKWSLKLKSFSLKKKFHSLMALKSFSAANLTNTTQFYRKTNFQF